MDEQFAQTVTNGDIRADPVLATCKAEDFFFTAVNFILVPKKFIKFSRDMQDSSESDPGSVLFSMIF
jgi:hypothetical protein